MVPGSHEDERLRWCGKRLNPRDFARGMRAATDLMMACKAEIMWLNLSPLLLKSRMFPSQEDSTPPRRSPVCLLATPESSPKTESEARRAAERIALRLEVMATTPLEDTRPIPLVDFSLSSPELDKGSEITTTPKRKTSRVPRRRLFHSPEKPAPEAAKES
ncbi:hypothetical protein HPB50_025642 [Hyalomma asiaticum]|uniref:Uncharacterized protein n=1 Tax=Hyalomma asiaticum TaxID=266040 RepID=A0ACB7TEA9_HYAAI|nr:hypothetical protein HPB50_025642 [Hyalomma asiaticum]